MPKVKNRTGPPQGRQNGRSVDQAVSDLGRLASDDRGSQRDVVPRGTPLEDDAERQERREGPDADVYEKIMGKKAPGARKQMQQRDEHRPGLELDEEEDELDEEEETEEINARDAEDDLEGPDEDDDAGDAEAPRVTKKQLEKARNALRRAGAPAWAFDEEPERVLELARSYSGYQSNADRALQSKDETIRALSSALSGGGKGKQAGAAGENPETETPSEEDLVRAAEGLARSMGVEADEGTKKALVEFGRAARKGAGSSAEKQELDRLRGTVADMLIDQGIRGVRRRYAEHLSDPDARQRLRKRMVALDSEGGFGSDIGRLAREAARSLWGDPARAKEGRARARKSGAPVTSSRREERRSKGPEVGTEDHDRAVFRAITKGERSRFAVRR